MHFLSKCKFLGLKNCEKVRFSGLEGFDNAQFRDAIRTREAALLLGSATQAPHRRGLWRPLQLLTTSYKLRNAAGFRAALRPADGLCFGSCFGHQPHLMRLYFLAHGLASQRCLR